VNFRVLVKLSQSFVQPQRHRCAGFADEEVCVLVVDDRVRVIALGIQAHQDIILVLCSHEQAAEFERSFCEVGFRFEGAEIFIAFDCDHDDRAAGIHV